MRNLITGTLFIVAMLPIIANADIRSDMQDSELSLVQVVQNALDEGMPIDAIVAEMIDVSPEQSNSIVATAMILRAEAFESIILAAITGGAEPTEVVRVALAASDGENERAIVRAVTRAAPESADEVQQLASQLTEGGGPAGPTATPGPQVEPTIPSASGGGSASTAEDVDNILAASAEVQTVLNEVEAALADAGFTAAEVTTAVDQITQTLSDAQANVDTAITFLTTLRDDVQAGATTDEILAGIDDAIASISGDAATG